MINWKSVRKYWDLIKYQVKKFLFKVLPFGILMGLLFTKLPYSDASYYAYGVLLSIGGFYLFERVIKDLELAADDLQTPKHEAP